MFNDGLILRCEVIPDDFVVYRPDVKKVRCKRVRVIGDYEKK